MSDQWTNLVQPNIREFISCSLESHNNKLKNNYNVLIKNKKKEEKVRNQECTSPAFTVITCGVNPTPADPVHNYQEIMI